MELPRLRYIAIVSGLNIGSDHCSQLSVEVLVDYLAGHLGGPRDRDHLRRVVRVIIAGNSITDKPTKSAVKEEKKVFVFSGYLETANF